MFRVTWWPLLVVSFSCSKLLEYGRGGMQELSGFAELPGMLVIKY